MSNEESLALLSADDKGKEKIQAAPVYTESETTVTIREQGQHNIALLEKLEDPYQAREYFEGFAPDNRLAALGEAVGFRVSDSERDELLKFRKICLFFIQKRFYKILKTFILYSDLFNDPAMYNLEVLKSFFHAESEPEEKVADLMGALEMLTGDEYVRAGKLFTAFLHYDDLSDIYKVGFEFQHA